MTTDRLPTPEMAGEREKRVAENGTVGTAYAKLLNDLVDMQASPAYAVRKGVLADAERTILDLERRVKELTTLSETEARWIPVAEEIAKVRIQAVTATLPIFTMHKGQWYRLDGLKEPK